ncbi:MAG: hypothetical protein Ct9H90mP13_02770 [Pseudomonadota bacterium]|nr:MAG: hypothetical protein Ct9H90mP13_02770 [Pseudomonadota bacterium]
MQVMTDNSEEKFHHQMRENLVIPDAKMEANSRLFEGIETDDEQPVWMSHGEESNLS